MNLRDGLNTYPSSHTTMVRKPKIRGSEKERDGLAVPSLEEQHCHKPPFHAVHKMEEEHAL